MTGSFDSLKKAPSPNGAGKPKLERLNAKKNTKYVPLNEGSPTVSSPAHISRIGGTITGEFLTSFRLSGNNLEEEIENICRSTGISKQEFVGGISQESWQRVSDQRKSRSGPLPSNQITLSTDSAVQPAQNLDPWSKGISYLSNSPLSIQNQPSEPSFGNSRRKSFDSAVAGDTTYFNGRVDRVSAGASNTATSESASVASCGKSKASYQDKQDSFLDSTFYAHHKATVTSSSSQYLYRPSVQIQAISELNPFVDNERASYPLTTCDLDTASSPVEFPQTSQLGLPESKSSNAVLNLSANKDGTHDELVTKESVFRERTEDSAHEHLPVEKQTDMAATVERRLMNIQTANYAAEEQTISLNEELSQSAQTMNYLQQSQRQTLVKARPRTPWSFWRKGDFLGSGSFGTVYEGVNSEGLFFAVKEVSLGDEGRGAQQSILQLEQEIEILSQFQHENIVQYLGTQHEEHKLYIFLEFMTKGALSTVYKKIPLFDSQIRSYTRQILCGLKYLHEMDIVHRDVKCANILVHANGTVKLADFGMARVLKKSEQLKSCKGSAYWMAPEVIIPKKTYSFPADIWSLGCTVLEMATGSPPFGFMEWNTVLWKVGHGEIPPIPDKLQDDAKDFIRQCLQVDPAMRPTADVLLEHPFIKSKNWHSTSIHSSKKPVLVATIDSLAQEDSVNLDGPSSSQGTSSYSSSDSSAFGDDEPKVRVSGSKFSAHSVRTRRSTRMLQ